MVGAAVGARAHGAVRVLGEAGVGVGVERGAEKGGATGAGKGKDEMVETGIDNEIEKKRGLGEEVRFDTPSSLFFGWYHSQHANHSFS